MEFKTITLNSEYEFRNYVISNTQNISKIIIFEDNLENIIYFYCFYKNGNIIATKELNHIDFFHIKETYKDLATDFSFSFSKYKNQQSTILLIPNTSQIASFSKWFKKSGIFNIPLFHIL